MFLLLNSTLFYGNKGRTVTLHSFVICGIFWTNLRDRTEHKPFKFFLQSNHKIGLYNSAGMSLYDKAFELEVFRKLKSLALICS